MPRSAVGKNEASIKLITIKTCNYLVYVSCAVRLRFAGRIFCKNESYCTYQLYVLVNLNDRNAFNLLPAR